jgi:hypothetical protein
LINLNDHNITFSDPASPQSGYDHFSIGQDYTYCKFNVYNKKDMGAGSFISVAGVSNSTNNYGLLITTTHGNSNFGIKASSDSGQNCYGVYGKATNASNNYGMSANASYGSNAYGIKANADYATNCYGVYGKASYGSFNAAGYFVGDLAYTGSLYQASDIMLKQNITPISNAMSIISQLQPKTYTFKTNDYSNMNLPAGTNYGLIANEVEMVLPNIVKTNVHPAETDDDGNVISPELSYKGINYTELIPILIQGMKEQKNTIDSLKNQIRALQTTPLPGNKSMGGQNNNMQNNYQVVELATENLIILNQNDPNPFAEETDITYFLPETVNNAKMMFYDNTGRIIKAVELQGTGNGTLHVYASNLSSGIYVYALIVDGKVIDTKKMVCNKK